MQTFLPWPSYQRTAECLDYRRLGKQRVEAMQILHILVGIDSDSHWKAHPAVRMWRGYEYRLALYTVRICDEWIRRGYQDTCREKILDLASEDYVLRSWEYPPWHGDKQFHLSHRRTLMAKDPGWYSQHFRCKPLRGTIWPVR